MIVARADMRATIARLLDKLMTSNDEPDVEMLEADSQQHGGLGGGSKSAAIGSEHAAGDDQQEHVVIDQ
jgi:hypothetical protein